MTSTEYSGVSEVFWNEINTSHLNVESKYV